MSEIKEVATKTSDPTEAQFVEEAIRQTSVEEAERLIKPGNEYDITRLLTAFELEFNVRLKNKDTKSLRMLTDAKNVLLRNKIEQMVEKDGRFNLSGLIPFETACLSCKGTGEIYKFFKQTIPVDCKFCDQDENGKSTGRKTVRCKSCKGTGKFKKPNGQEVDCRTCDKDENGKPTGTVTFKCRKCRGTGTFQRLAIDSKIKSTTHCKACKGRGFISEEKTAPKKKPKTLPLKQPVLSADLGEQIKAALVKE